MSAAPRAAAGAYAASFGAIALAAYKPDEPMFARQLQSIQAQTHTQFVCLISVDGNPEPVRAMVRRACGQDDRFRVLGYENRLGFHHNFERALKEVPAEARWVALSDQDDYWYSEKLSALLPQLDKTALVTGQARVVTPEVSATDRDPTKGNLTDRRSVGAADLIANNQVTGSLCVFRREVLDLALPFPSMPTPAQYHDHWIGICALAVGGVKVQNLILQDYIQHGGNVVGESRQRLLSSIRNTFRFVRRYEGNASPRSICRIIYKTGLGWRQLMAQTLRDRLALRGILPLDGLERALAIYSRPHCAALIRLLIRGMRGGNVPPMRVLEILMGAALRRWGS